MHYKEFYKCITEDIQTINELAGEIGYAEYIPYHARRFYTTYLYCKKHLKKGDKVLTIGAGVGSIEKALVQSIGVEVTVLDLPDAIDLFKPYFSTLGFKTVSANATDEIYDLPERYYDMLLYSEIIEHLPKAPSAQLKSFTKHLAPNASILITTPNFASIFTIIRLLLMQPVIPPPEKTFGPVNFENQAIHRREYLPCEIIDSFDKLGFKYVEKAYFHYTFPRKIKQRILYSIGTLIPRFKQGMLLVGRAN